MPQAAAAFRYAKAGMGAKLRERTSAETADDVYRLDPLSHLDEGHVTIRDLETKRPVIFRPYDHEAELIDTWIDVPHLQRHHELRWRNVHEEKSRAMGITWTCAYVFLWATMYWPVALLAQHVDLGRIDDGGNESTVESLFGKIRYMARADSWPEWLRPITYLHFRQQPEHVITNTLNGAFIVGRGQEDDPARGGQYDAYLGDEFARIQHASQVQESLVSACPTGRLYNSTPYGEDNEYYRLREARSSDVVYLRHHWSVHPFYSEGMHVAGEDPDCELCAANRDGVPWTAENPRAHRYPGKLTSPWYDAMVLRLLDDESIAQELDIDYRRALSARVYPEFSEEIHVLPVIPYDHALSVELSIDYGYAPSFTSVGIWQDALDSLRKIGEVEVTEHTPEQVAQALRKKLVELGVPEQDTRPQFTRTWRMIGDPSGEARELGSGESLARMYRKQGFEIISKRQRVRSTILAMKHLLYGVPKPVRYSAATCPKTIRHMKNNRYVSDRFGKPKAGFQLLNDEHNHMTSADRYYVAFKYPAPKEFEDQTEQSGFVKDPELPYFRLSKEMVRDMVSDAEGDRTIQPNMRL